MTDVVAEALERVERFVSGETFRTIYVLPPGGRFDPARADLCILIDAVRSGSSRDLAPQPVTVPETPRQAEGADAIDDAAWDFIGAYDDTNLDIDNQHPLTPEWKAAIKRRAAARLTLHTHVARSLAAGVQRALSSEVQPVGSERSDEGNLPPDAPLPSPETPESGDGEKTWLIPLAVWLAAERVRVDAANTMRHDTTSDLTPRLMCRVGVSDIGLVLAWLDQHRTTEAKDA